ncbi:MAG: hypothetical protein RDV48_30115 [Candidatus Eremiobacteraeota bacterium]|nr:hypothetical protein [Candidatus Eremiobacteraeota bacterium]
MQRRNLIFALVFIGIGGFLLHLRIHSPLVEGHLRWQNLFPAIGDLATVFVVTMLFMSKGTADIAYVINGLTVIIGIILMSHFSIAHALPGKGFTQSILSSTFCDSLILFGKFFVGKEIFDHYYPERTRDDWKYPQGFRYLHNGWWLVHFAGITLVYIIGVLIFKH